MRKLFSRQLIEARHEMLSIYEAVDLALHDAVKAYVTDDRKLATKTKKRTLSIDARCANLEARLQSQPDRHAVTGRLRLPPASDDHLRRL